MQFYRRWVPTWWVDRRQVQFLPFQSDLFPVICHKTSFLMSIFLICQTLHAEHLDVMSLLSDLLCCILFMISSLIGLGMKINVSLMIILSIRVFVTFFHFFILKLYFHKLFCIFIKSYILLYNIIKNKKDHLFFLTYLSLSLFFGILRSFI
jgi:hypothetical protein